MRSRFRIIYVLILCGLTLAAVEGLLRAWYPAPTRHYVWPPNLRVEFAPTDAATPGVAGRGRFWTNSLGLLGLRPSTARRRRRARPGNGPRSGRRWAPRSARAG